MAKLNLFGLIGYPLTHSFSKKYFSNKFEKEEISNCQYELFPIESIDELPFLIQKHPSLKGLNVTIPYKEVVFPFLNEIDEAAKKVGAVNTIKIKDGKLIGYNTDVYGFEISLKKSLAEHFKNKPNTKNKATLILGTGGAAKAVAYVLKKLNIDFKFVSRQAHKGNLMYQDLNKEILQDHFLIINTTPLGTAPNIQNCPSIPYNFINDSHFLYDLVYNPEKTLFLNNGAKNGARTSNGLEMLYLQAEKAWEIWKEDSFLFPNTTTDHITR